MDPVTIATLVTAVGPSLVTLIKRIFRTDQLPKETRRVVHSTLPLAIGLAASILACVSGDCVGGNCPEAASWAQCIMAGLAGGAGASYLRDVDKNILGIGAAVSKLRKKNASA